MTKVFPDAYDDKVVELSVINSHPSYSEFDHCDRNAIDFLARHLSKPSQIIRIATGFFTLKGYDLLRRQRVYEP